MSSHCDLPTPTTSLRDAADRLVALTLSSDNAPPERNTWLVAVDGSTESLQAVAEAIRLSVNTQHKQLHLAHIQPWMSMEAAESELARRSWEATVPARALIEAAGLRWQLHAALGECAEKIVSIAEKNDCYGIVIGSRGHGAAASLLLGSTASKVIHLSSLPVVVAKRPLDD